MRSLIDTNPKPIDQLAAKPSGNRSGDECGHLIAANHRDDMTQNLHSAFHKAF